MIAGGLNKLPYGNIPRLLLAWVCTEAVRTQSRELVLGASLSEFMDKLGMAPVGGGPTGARTRLRNQIRRLFSCTVSLIYEDARVEATLNAPIARRTEFWWSERQPDVPSLWDSKDRARGRFFQRGHRAPGPARHEHPARATWWRGGCGRPVNGSPRRCAGCRLHPRGGLVSVPSCRTARTGAWSIGSVPPVKLTPTPRNWKR